MRSRVHLVAQRMVLAAFVPAMRSECIVHARMLLSLFLCTHSRKRLLSTVAGVAGIRNRPSLFCMCVCVCECECFFLWVHVQ